MSDSFVRLQASIEQQQLEQKRWRQTLKAVESADHGKVVDADKVHRWLGSWGSENEEDAPESGK